MVVGLIHDWHRGMFTGQTPFPAMSAGGLVMGCPLYGEVYSDRFAEYVLPSMLSRRNRYALERMDWQIVMFVDGYARERLKAADAPLAFVDIPQPIMDGVLAEGNYKYPLLTACHNILVHKARDIGAGFHMLVGDTIYGDGYFENLERLAKTHDAMAQTALTVEAFGALPAIEKYRQADGSIAVPGWQLAYIGVEHMAPDWASWNMDGITDFSEMPSSHYIHFRSKDTIRAHCAHKNVAWINNDRCTRIEPHLGGTLDSELPRYIAGGFYTPRLEDDMAVLSLSGHNPPVGRQPWASYKRGFWDFIGNGGKNNRFLPYWLHGCEWPAPYDGSRPDRAEIDATFGRLMEKLYEGID